MNSSRKDMARKMDDSLWAYRTTFKTPIGTSPYKLVYSKGCHLLIELEHKTYWTIRQLNMDMQAMSEKRLLQLNKLDEFRNNSYEKLRFIRRKPRHVMTSISHRTILCPDCNTPKYTLVVFNMFRVFCKHNLNFS